MPRSKGEWYCSSRRSSIDGIQSAPCSVNATRSTGKRSNTPPKMSSHSGRRAHHMNSTFVTHMAWGP